MLFRETSAPGLLVTVDGPNGAGKTTLVEAVVDELQKMGAAVHATRQPSPTALGDTVRSVEREVRGRALACLVAGDRHHQVANEILPRLKEGAVVLCDRYVESSLVLQQLDGVDVEFILAINAGVPRPHLRVRLFATPQALSGRLARRPPDLERRFERTASREDELELYARADSLLAEREDAPSIAYDTTSTTPDELGAVVAQIILSKR